MLGLPPAAPARDVEREAQKLLGMLELGMAAAATYATPLGPRPRTPELVRAAAAALRDPRRRLVAELWAAAGDAAIEAATPPLTRAVGDHAGADAGDATAGWPDALAGAGWGGPRR